MHVALVRKYAVFVTFGFAAFALLFFIPFRLHANEELEEMPPVYVPYTAPRSPTGERVPTNGTSRKYNVVFAANHKQMEAALIAAHSLVMNFRSDARRDLAIHAIIADTTGAEIQKLRDFFCVTADERWAEVEMNFVPFNVERFEVQHGLDIFVSRIVGEARETTTRNELSAMENYLRFFFDLLFPDIDNVLYMDVDTLILKDASQVIDALYANPSVTYAFAERPTKKTAAENFNVLALKKCYRTHYKPTVSQMKSREIFNHGVFAINLRRYYSLGYRQLVMRWINRHNSCPFWKGGSQMPLQLTLWETGEDYIVIDKEWNFCDLGYRQDMNSTILREQGILHWNGARKPWRSDGLYRDVWLPYWEDVQRAEEALKCPKQICPKLTRELSSNCGFRYDCVDVNSVLVRGNCRGEFTTKKGKSFICESLNNNEVVCNATQSGPTPDGPFFIQNKITGRNIQARSTPVVNGVMIMYGEGYGDDHRFETVPTNDGDGSFFLRNYASGLCLHTEYAETVNGGKLLFWNTCRGEKNKFMTRLTGDGDGSFFLSSKRSGYCVNTQKAQAEEGSLLVWWDKCAGSKNKFIYIPAPSGTVDAEKGQQSGSNEQTNGDESDSFDEQSGTQ